MWFTRRETAGCLGVLIAAAATAMCVGGTPWTGSWKMALDWTSGSLVLVGPVAAGIAAWHYSRLQRSVLAIVIRQAGRGPRPWFRPAVGIAAAVVAVLVATGLLATTIADRNGSVPAPHQLAILLLAVPALVAQVMIGVWLGTRFPGPWAAPVAAVGVFGLGAMSSAGVIPETFRTGGVTGTLVGQEYDATTLLAQGTVALAVVAVAVVAVLRVVWPTPPRVTSGVATVVVAAAAACVLSGASGEERYVSVPVGLRCAGDAPEVCMAVDATRPLRGLVPELAAYTAPLRELGAPVPRRWVQSIPGRGRNLDDGVLIFVNSDNAAATVDRRALAISVATPADCAAFHAPVPPVEALQAQGLLADWILTERGGPASGSDPGTVRWLGSAAARTWVLATYRSLAACDLERIRMPSFGS